MASSQPRPPAGRRRSRSSRSGNPAVRSGHEVARPRTVPGSAPAPSSGTSLFDLPTVPPPEGAAYPQVLRGESYAWWRSVLGVVAGIGLFLLLTTVVSQAVVAAAWALTAGDVVYREYVTSAFAFVRPAGMLAANLGIATLIGICWVLVALVHLVEPRWLSSVQPGLRRGYLLRCLGIAAGVLGAVVALSAWAGPPVRFAPQAGFWLFAVVIVLTSPLQAAAEEYFFRGYLTQALGSLFAHPAVGVVLSAVVFALFHGTQNLALFVDRLAFGLLAALLVWRTGGLEAGIAAHVVNNVFAYLFAGLTGSIAALRAVQDISWVQAAFDVGGFGVFALLAWLLARRLRLRRHVVLAAPRV